MKFLCTKMIFFLKFFFGTVYWNAFSTKMKFFGLRGNEIFFQMIFLYQTLKCFLYQNESFRFKVTGPIKNHHMVWTSLQRLFKSIGINNLQK